MPNELIHPDVLEQEMRALWAAEMAKLTPEERESMAKEIEAAGFQGWANLTRQEIS